MFRIFGQRKRRTGKMRRSQRPPAGRPTGSSSTLERFVVEEIEVSAVPEPVAAGPRPKRRAKWFPTTQWAMSYAGLWLLLFASSLFTRSPWPVDETRTLAVAWEMWLAHASLVPTLNGEVYAHSPLDYWLIHVGWRLFGVNDWWPRMLPALFALANLFVTASIARRLWPRDPMPARYTPLVLLGTLFYALYTTVALPDMLVVFSTLVGMWALLSMWRARDSRAWLVLGLALGIGLLAGGPVAAVYILPAALAAPLWAKEKSGPDWKYWYGDVLKALLLGVALLASWLVPAAISAGAHFASQYLAGSFVRQTLGLFPAIRFWWWYAFLLPFLFLPWSMWPLVWMRLWHIRRRPTDPGIAFCIAWAVPAVVLLSLLPVKQPQFLLPILPAGALFFAYLLLAEELQEVHQHQPLAGMTIPFILLGCALAVIPKLPRVEFLPDLLWELSPFVGIGIAVTGMALAWLPLNEMNHRVRNIASVATLLIVFVVLGIGSQFDHLYSIEAAAQYLGNVQLERRAVAHVGEYQGEYEFAGRLREPLTVIQPEQIGEWLAWNPQGAVVTYSNSWQPHVPANVKPAFETSYRDHTIRVWDSAALLAAGL